MSCITPNTRWYPQTHYYAGHVRDYPFFLRATQNKGFKKLAKVTGIGEANTLREQTKAGMERLEVGKWRNFHFSRNFWSAMNMDKLDTLK